MHTALIIVHVVVAVALILIVLLQTGKGASMGAAFGGGASGTVFGSRGPSGFLTKVTAVAAIMFMFTCLGLSIFQGDRLGSDSIMRNVATESPEGASPTSETDQEEATQEATQKEATEPSQPAVPADQAKPIAAPDSTPSTEGSGENK